MVDRERRNLLADQIHAFIGGFVTNDEFDDWLWDAQFDPLRDPRRYDDAALGPAVEWSYCLYGDRSEYRLVGERKLDRETYRSFLRWILFLRSDLDYEWPPMLFAVRFFPEVNWLMWLMSRASFRRRSLQPRLTRSFSQWKTHGDFSVYPFLSGEQYLAVRDEQCWLNQR